MVISQQLAESNQTAQDSKQLPVFTTSIISYENWKRIVFIYFRHNFLCLLVLEWKSSVDLWKIEMLYFFLFFRVKISLCYFTVRKAERIAIRKENGTIAIDVITNGSLLVHSGLWVLSIWRQVVHALPSITCSSYQSISTPMYTPMDVKYGKACCFPGDWMQLIGFVSLL